MSKRSPDLSRQRGTAARRITGAIASVLVALTLLAGGGSSRAADLVGAPPPSIISAQPDPYTSFCGGRCAVTGFIGPRLETAAANVFGVQGGFVPPWNYRYGNGGLFGATISRELYRWSPYFTIEAEVGAGKRFGDLHEEEVWGALYGRWTWFPWNQYIRTSAALSTGLNYATGNPPYQVIRTQTRRGARLLHYLAPELTLGLPQYPQWDLVLRLHHRSGFKLLGCVHAFKCAAGGAQETVAGLRYHF